MSKMAPPPHAGGTPLPERSSDAAFGNRVSREDARPVPAEPEAKPDTSAARDSFQRALPV